MPNPIGVNTWTWVSPFTTDKAPALFSKIKQMGFNIVELPVEDPSHVEAGAIKRLLDENGLTATVCGAFGPSRDLASDDPANIRNSLGYLRELVQFAQGVGATVVAGPMYSAVGKARQVPPDVRKAEFDMAVGGLKQAASVAADHGVTLAIEPLNRFETDMVNTAAQARAMVDAVDHPNVGIHLDTFHMNIEEENVYDAILLAGKELKHVHASESHRGTPGKGLAAWDDLARGLKEVGYTGPVVIETFTPEVKEIARAAAIWRPLAPSQDSLASEGMGFLRRLLAK
jgi:D-psicose/D-tagatose/L-ribulose 3-epimerase